MGNKGWVLGIVCAFCTAITHAQEVERDYSKYLRPVIFLLPEAPSPTSPSSSRKYLVKIDILANGTVQLPVEVEPDETPMVAAINDAARFWLFAPGITSDCKPGPRSGKVSLEYDTGKGRAWIELPGIEKNLQSAFSYDLTNRGDNVRYPVEEAHRGTGSGAVTIVLKLMSDGSSSEHVVYTAMPPSKGFIKSAMKGASQIAVKFREPIDKPFLCTLVTYSFKVG